MEEVRNIGVLTSGGDSAGMNAAIYSIVRRATNFKSTVFFIKNGYKGMVDGGDSIEEANTASVSSISNKGGTVIGSTRCEEFLQREGRRKAALNLINKKINHIVVIGGDGSLTGSNVFAQEWPSLLRELLSTGDITQDDMAVQNKLHIVGIVGTIDNDFHGTDIALGTYSALTRIQEQIDAIKITAESNQKAFIIEVMGRRCGYLAMVSGLSCEADYIFIPERPPPINWPAELTVRLQQERTYGKRWSIVVLCEGATDLDGSKITAEQVRTEIINRTNIDTRIVVLGDVQRGGCPSAFDIILGCQMGVEAVNSLMEATSTTEAHIIGLSGNELVRSSIEKCLERNEAIERAMSNKEWSKVVDLRGRIFVDKLKTYDTLKINLEEPDLVA